MVTGRHAGLRLQEVVVDDVNSDQRKGNRHKDRLSGASPGQPAEPDAPPDVMTGGAYRSVGDGHSYCSALRTFRRAARRAGRIAASIPARIVASTKIPIVLHGIVEDDPLVGECLGREDGKEDADHDSERASDQRGDDALVTDHSAYLPTSHPHSSQHPDLACSLEDREHECVHHAEQADDH